MLLSLLKIFVICLSFESGMVLSCCCQLLLSWIGIRLFSGCVSGIGFVLFGLNASRSFGSQYRALHINSRLSNRMTWVSLFRILWAVCGAMPIFTKKV